MKMYYHILIVPFVRLIASDITSAIFRVNIYIYIFIHIGETHLIIEQFESIFAVPASDQQLLFERFESSLHYAQVPGKID